MAGKKTDSTGAYWDHDPGAKLDYTAKWTDWLAEVGDAIASATWSVTPSGLSVVSTFVSGGNKATVWVSGGVEGTTHTLTSQIWTTAGRRDHRSFRLKVKNR